MTLQQYCREIVASEKQLDDFCEALVTEFKGSQEALEWIGCKLVPSFELAAFIYFSEPKRLEKRSENEED